MKDDLYQFLVCEYFGTGEGSTVMLLITRAYPCADDYETPGDYNFETKEFVPPVMKQGYTPKVIAAREFAEEFGGWYLRMAENLPREEFMARYSHFIPEYVKRAVSSTDCPGNFHFKQSVHINFS